MCSGRAVLLYEGSRCDAVRGVAVLRDSDLDTPRSFTAPIDALFEHVSKQALSAVTIGIGDGGNEIGMGNVCDAV